MEFYLDKSVPFTKHHDCKANDRQIARLMKENARYHAVLKTNAVNINYDLITYVGDRLGHDARYAIDPSKIVLKLGWYPITSFPESIKKQSIGIFKTGAWLNLLLRLIIKNTMTKCMEGVK